jgi:hypothetical protein
MRANLSLNLVYRYETTMTEDGPKAYYKIIYFFSEAGFITKSTLTSIYKKLVPLYTEREMLTFDDLELLGQFALKVCMELQAPEVFVLSVQDYNIGMESVRDVRAYKELFRRYGNCITNPELENERQSVFKRIFSKDS